MSLAIRFRLRDGPNKGAVTRPYGGVWDKKANRGAGKFVGWYDPLKGWVGKQPDNVRTTEVAEQQLKYVTDFWHKIILALGGRRSGKSGALAPKAVICAIVFAGQKGGILAPTYRQAKNIWRHLRRIVPREWLMPGRAGIRRSEHTLNFINGSSIVLLSADRPDTARSEGVAWWGIDERQDVGEEAFSNAYFGTSEGGGKYCLFETGTIKPELREHYDRLMASPKAEVYTMDSYGNPFICHDFLDDAAEFMDRARIDRELHAKWPSLYGRVYYPFVAEPGAHVRDYPLRRPGGQPLDDITAAFNADRFDTPEAPNLISIDPPHHAIVYRIYRGDTLHAIDEVIVGLDGLKADVRDLAKACWARYPGGVAVRDPHDSRSGGKGSHDCDKYFRAVGYKVSHLQRVLVENRLTTMRSLMERNRYFVDPRCKHLIECLKRQTYKQEGKRRVPDKTIVSMISPPMTIDHSGDSAGYMPYKLWPADFDFEANEQKAA